jgi:methionyl-tRNA formyltransferase
MRIVFFGSSDYSIQVLKELMFLDFKSLHVVTQPDKPKGRGMKTQPTEVKYYCQIHGIHVMSPENLKDAAFLDEIRAIKPDLLLIASYGNFLPQELLDIPRLCLCLHPSLLPKYRGAAPVNWALLNGETTTGVTLFKVVKKMDAGDVFMQERIDIAPGDDSISLFEKVAMVSKRMLEIALPMIKAGRGTFTPQDESQVSFAPKIDKEAFQIDWTKDGETVINKVRALSSFSCAWSMFRGKRIKFWKVDSNDFFCQCPVQKREQNFSFKLPGEIIYVDKHCVRIACGCGREFVPLVVQPEGKHKMDVTDFISGVRPLVGERFE